MTNLQAGERRFPLTPEQALVALPAFGALLLAGIVAFVGLRPLLVNVQAQRERLRSFQEQEADLPLLRQQLNTLIKRQEESRRKQQRVSMLVANDEQLNTLLAALNQQAVASGIQITNFAPLEGEPSAKPNPNPAAAADAGADPTQSEPPAAVPGGEDVFEQKRYQLDLAGNFTGVLAFLRRMETLNTAILIRDLTISREKEDDPMSRRITASFQFSAYRRLPRSEEGKRARSASPEGPLADSGDDQVDDLDSDIN